MTKVIVDKSKIDILANAIADKSGESLTMTLDEMVEAVDGIQTGGSTPTGNIDITQAGVTDVTDYATATVPAAMQYIGVDDGYFTENNVLKWHVRGFAEIDLGAGDKEGWVSEGTQNSDYVVFNAIAKNTSITPTTSSQTIGGQNYMMEGAVTVAAIDPIRDPEIDIYAESGYVYGTYGYYPDNIVMQLPSGTEGTPTATKGAVSNHAISVTPSVTNAEGWIDGGTHGGTAVSVSASELVSGTYTVDSSGTKDVTNYASASVPAGTTGTPTASKGAVSNHSVSVTPSVTNSTGWITGSTKTGTAVTVSASELVSGSQTITDNGTVDVTNLASVTVAVSGGGSGMNVATATATPSTASRTISFTGLSGEPTSFHVVCKGDLATASQVKVSAVAYDGTDHIGQTVTNTSNAQASYDDGFSHTYNNGTLTVTATTAYFQAEQYSLVYTYGGNSSNIGTADVQVGSGATSITFTGLTEEPSCWSCVFKSDFGTSSGYTRTIAVVNDGNSIYGMEMGSGAQATSHWTASYSNGSLTISSQSTSAGGYFHQPGYYQLTYGIGGEVEPPTIEPLNVTQNGTYEESGKAYSPVTVNVSGGGSASTDTKTVTASNRPSSLSFTSMKGEPIMWALRATFTMTSSSTTYYYVDSMRGIGTSNVQGRLFRMGSTRETQAVTAGYSASYSNGTFTVTSSGNRTTSPGCFYNGSYELVYAY